MAKLFKQAGSSLREKPKTHEADDASIRERGATGVFRNMAFQENVEEETVASPSGKVPATPSFANKSVLAVSTNERDSSIPESPRLRGSNGQGAILWATPPATPNPATTAKRGSQYGCPTPRSNQRFTPGKRFKNATAVEELAGPELAAEDSDQQGSEDCSGMVWARSNCGNNFVNSNHASVQAWEEEVRRLVGAGRREDAVQLVAPSDGMIHCTVRRVRNFLGKTLAYHLFLDNGDVFLLAARKRVKSKVSNYVLSSSQNDLGKDSSSCVAKLRANFVGTEYSLCGRGSGSSMFGGSEQGSRPGTPTGNSGNSRPSSPGEPFAREELAVHYKQTVLTAKGGPRVMLVATPLPDSNWAPSAPNGSDSLPASLEAARKRELPPRLERQLCMLATRPPEWDPTLKAYTLDFHGRVRASSVKNFQLVHWDHNTDRKGSDLVLQFGKVEDGSDDFALDFTYPLSLQKAFAIALASTDSKLCCAL